MGQKSISADKIRQILELRQRGFSTREIARELEVSQGTVTNYLKKFAKDGGAKLLPGDKFEPPEPPPKPEQYNRIYDRTDIDGTVELIKLDRPGTPDEIMDLCQLDRTKWIPTHYRPNSWQGFARIKKPTGEVIEKVQLFQTKVSFRRVVTEELEEAILQFVRNHIVPLPKPNLSQARERVDGQMLCWGLWDAHLGMYAWNKEVGADFDLNIAVKRVTNSIDDMMVELEKYKIEKLLMPVGNDFMHFDSVRHTTTFGEHFLDTDTRYAKVYLGALECLSYMIDRALEICDDIELLYVPGNHDYTSGFTLAVALDQRYRNDPRVTADLSMNPRKYRAFGGTLLGFDHGKDVKSSHYPTLIASEAKDLWSQSTWREVQIGHTHQRRETMHHGLTPTNGVLVRTNPSLSNVDAWHHSKGFIGEPLKSVEAWRYDRTGYRGSHVVFAR